MDLFLILSYYLSEYGKPALYAAALVLGIIIICNKDKATKLLGIWIAACALESILGVIYVLLARYGGAVFLSRFALYKSVMAFIFSSAATVMLFLYAKYSYGIKFSVLIVLLSVKLGSTLINSFLMQNVLSYRRIGDTVNYGYFSNILNLIPGIAVTVILLIIFIKNKHREAELKLLWLSPLSSLIVLSLYLCIYSVLIFSESTGFSKTENFVEYVVLFASVTLAVIQLMFSIYILKNGRKSSFSEPLEIVD